MNLRDMGDKQGGRTWWGLAILGLHGLLLIVEELFGEFLPPDVRQVVLLTTKWVGGLVLALGLGRKVGKIAGTP